MGNLARETGRNRHADRITALLNSGAVLPFLSFHHLLELHQRSNPEVRLRRRQYLESLKLVAFHKTSEDSPNVGDIIDLQCEEAMTLVRKPDLALEEVVDATKPKVRSGMCSGADSYPL